MAVINNGKSNTLLSGTSGDDSIKNYGENVTIESDDGNDTIKNILYMTAKRDYEPDSVSINSGSGEDYIHNNYGYWTIINTGKGNDSVYNHNSGWVTINTGSGNDSVYNWSCGFDIIDCGVGNDSIYNNSSNNDSIYGGSGNDLISLSSGYNDYHDSHGNVIIYNSGDGKDTIYGFDGDDTLSISGGSYSTTKSGDDIIVTVGDGKISLVGAASLSKVNIKFKKTSSTNSKLITLTEGNDTCNNSVSGATINALGGNDTIYNNKSNVSISGGKGNDYIQNSIGADNCTLRGGDGNDTISNNVIGNMVDGNIGGDKVLIDGGAGNDSILNDNDEDVTLLCGAGDDTVVNWAINTSIDGGDGKDLIYIYYNGSTITGGKGNDTIYEYNYDESIGDGILYRYGAGDGNDFISGFRSSDTLSIGGGSYSTKQSGSNLIVTVGDGKITLAGVTSANIKGTLDGGNNLKRITLTEGNDTYSNTISGATIDALGGKDTVYNYADNVSIGGGAGNDYLYNGDSQAGGGLNVTITGGKGNDTIELWATKTATVYGGDGNDLIGSSTLSQKILLSGGAGNDSIYNPGSNATINGGKGNDNIYNQWDHLWGRNSGYGENVLFEYSLGDGNDKIYCFTSTDTLSIGGGSYSTKQSGDNIIVTVGEGKISLIGAASLSSVNIKGTETVTEKNSWKLSGTTATYGTSSKTLVTVTGVKSLDGISLKNKVVTVAASALNKSKVTISNGYTLKLGSDVSTTATTSNDWSYKNSVATLKQTKGAAYSLASDGKSISYSAGTSKTLTKVSGVKSSSGLSVSGKVVTVAASALNKSKVTISGGYKLALSSDVSTTATTSNDWSYKNSVATLKQTRGEKYSLASNKKSISYTAATSKNLAKMSGVKSASGLKVSGKVITVPNAIIATSKKVSVNGGGNYGFKFAAKKTLITGSKNADIITSTGANSTINAGKGNDSINISGANNVIVYKNGDGRDTIINYSEDDTIRITSGTATSTVSGSDILFSVGNGSILLKDAADKTVSYVAGGVKKTYTATSAEPYTVKGTAVILASSYAEESFDVANVDGGSKIKTIDASAVSRKLDIVGNDNDNKIIGGKGNDSLDGLKGDDTLTGGNGADIFFYYDGDGEDVITDYEAKDIIRIEQCDVIPTVKGRDVVLNVGDGSIKVSNAAKSTIGVTYFENGVEHDYLNGEQTVVMNEKKTNATLTKNYWKSGFDFANFGKSISTVDATQVMHNIKITGNDKANKILGGSGKNTLIGGGGNDTLQGGDKADVFVYSAGDGNDILYNVGANDTISIVSGTVDFDSVKGDTVILKIGDGSISVEGGAGSKITYCDERGKTSKVYPIATANVLEDDNFIEANDLSALVQNKAADFSVINVESALHLANALETLTCSTKT